MSGHRTPESPWVILVAYRCRRDLPSCLAALALTAGGPPRLVVVDNGCPERSAEGVEEMYPGAEVVRSARNLGFGGGAMLGIRRALALGAEDVLLLNPDARPEPAWLAELLRARCDRPDAGILGSLILDERGEVLDHYQERLLALQGLTPGTEPIEVVTAIGAALLIRGSVLREVGGFDPLYFLYGEETDLAVRARHRGFEVLLVPRSRVRHRGEGTQTSAGLRFAARWYRARADGLLLLKRPHLGLKTGLIDLAARTLARGQGELRAGKLLDAALRAASVPWLLARLPAIRRSRRAEAAGPAHIAGAFGAEGAGAPGERQVTTTTALYRNSAQLGVLFDRVFPVLARDGGPVTVAVHACSSGAEPVSIALEWRRRAPAYGIRIRAGDRDLEVLPAARRLAAEHGVSRLVSFERVDLASDADVGRLAGADVVICQNVLIHFEPELEARVLRRVAATVPAGGFLLVAGRNPESGAVLGELGFVPVPDAAREVHEGWAIRRAGWDEAIALGEEPPYWSLPPFRSAGEDDLYRYGSIFRREAGLRAAPHTP